MQANLQDQQSLLKLAQIDLDIDRTKNEQRKIENAEEPTIAREKMLLLADRLIDSRNALSNINLELKRAEADLGLVESRIEKDNQRLSSTSSSKDAVGMQHELEALRRRKSELEDIELAVLEQKEIIEKEFAEISQEKSKADEILSQAENAQEDSLEVILKRANELALEKSKVSSTMNPEVLEAYLKRHQRGVAAARLVGRECGACRISITATNYEDIAALPSDQLPECPNCQAFLVR